MRPVVFTKLTRKWRIESTKHFYISQFLVSPWLKIRAGRSGLTKYFPEKKGYFALVLEEKPLLEMLAN